VTFMIQKTLAPLPNDHERVGNLRASCRAAVAHLDRAALLLSQDKPNGADHVLRFAVESLAEFEGYKGQWLKALVPSFTMPDVGYDPTDRRREEEHKIDFQFYSQAYSFVFHKPELEAQSFTMGQTYKIRIPFHVEGAQPDRDFLFEVALKSSLFAQTATVSNGRLAVPTSQWKPGKTYYYECEIALSPEDPPVEELFDNPPIEDEPYWLLVTLRDPETQTPVILANPTGAIKSRPGHAYAVARVRVSYYPVEIRHFTPADSTVLTKRNDTFVVANADAEAQAIDVLMTARAETGRVVEQQVKHVELASKGTKEIAFSWTPDTAGCVDLQVRLLRNNIELTEATQAITLNSPNDHLPSVVRANTVKQDGEHFSTPITVKADSGAFSAQVFAKDRLVAQGKSSKGQLVLAPTPWHGFYDVQVDLGTFKYDKRLVATVSEVRGTDLLMNGEPFILKGTNVHGMVGGSPNITRMLMQILKSAGFNALRGGSPAPWQMDMALEEGMVYTCLAPFSCKTTGNIFRRQPGPPTTTAREVARMVVQRYREKPSVLLWNSANEIQGETADLLEALYPIYKEMDPYNRPVLYSNLMYQYYTQGTDLMGYNIYFFFNKSAKALQLDLQKHLDFAKSQNMPMLFTEFNAWHRGAIISDGVEALEDFYVWGIEHGMHGGYHYKDDHSKRHPGVYHKTNFTTNKIHCESMHEAFDDAQVTVDVVNGNEVTLNVTNKRRFHLRDVCLTASIDGIALAPMQLEDLGPEKALPVSVPLPKPSANSAYVLEGTLQFTTHYGIHSNVPVSLLITE
jgi:Glycosyl hydrolases family 2, TIM barrel domain